MTGYIGQVLFFFLLVYGWRPSQGLQTCKTKEQNQYPAIYIEQARTIKDLLYRTKTTIIRNTAGNSKRVILRG